MLRIKVMPDGSEPYEVTATSRDIRAWEKGGSGRSFGKMADGLSMTTIYAIAHVTARRLGHLDQAVTLDQFAEATDIELVAEEEPDPTSEDLSVTPS